MKSKPINATCKRACNSAGMRFTRSNWSNGQPSAIGPAIAPARLLVLHWLNSESEMKLLYVGHFDPGFGGIQTYGLELCEGMRQRGCDVRWINCGPSLRQTAGSIRDYLPAQFTFAKFYYRMRY